MTTITTSYQRPLTRDLPLSGIGIHEFFQLPGDGTVYRLMELRRGSDAVVLNLDDLTLETLPRSTSVERIELNAILLHVEYVNE